MKSLKVVLLLYVLIKMYFLFSDRKSFEIFMQVPPERKVLCVISGINLTGEKFVINSNTLRTVSNFLPVSEGCTLSKLH